MSKSIGSASSLCLLFLISAGVQPARAMGGGGPPGWVTLLAYCRQTVANKGITDVGRIEVEVKKCFANPVTYPPAYNKPSW